MPKLRWRYLLAGVLLSPLLAGLALIFLVKAGWISVDARAVPSPLEAQLARALRAMGSEKAVNSLQPAIAPTQENVVMGAELYCEYCSQCHRGTTTPSSLEGAVFYPPPPELKELNSLSEAQIFWYSRRGIRLTGMPSFQDILSEQALWQISMFVKKYRETPAALQVLKGEAPVRDVELEYVVDGVHKTK
jgi:mono/diheme cytochrome c family protein